jgi:hypothetical protein
MSQSAAILRTLWTDTDDALARLDQKFANGELERYEAWVNR